MYCAKCGYKITETVNFCPKCGNSIKVEEKNVGNDIYQGNSSYSNRKKTFVTIGIILGCLIMIFGIVNSLKNNENDTGFSFQIGKTDMEIMVGTWSKVDGTVEFKFYEPSNSNRDYGDFEYIKKSHTYYGTYEWHEASKRMIVTVTDNWGSLDSMSYDYEIIDNNHVEFKQTENPDKTLSMERKNK